MNRRNLCRVVVVMAGSAMSMAAFAGPTVNTRYLPTMEQLPGSFQDGRTRFGDGAVTPMPNGSLESGDPEDGGPMAMCFEKGTDPKVVMAVSQMIQQSYQSRYQLGTRWSGTGGAPQAITWSFVPDGTLWGGTGDVGGQLASNLFAQLDSKFASSGGRATWIAQFDSVFARWASITGLSYTRVQNGANAWDDGAAWGSGSGATRGMVRIGMHNLDGANGVLAYNYFPQNGDMVLDSSETWQSSSSSFRFFRNTIAHEHGHGMGLFHVCPIQNTKLMEPFLSSSFDGPQQDDIRAAQMHYGDANESNNTAATATDLGALGTGTTTVGTISSPAVALASRLSLRDGDSDWYTFTLTQPRLVTFRAVPIGTNYADHPQDSQCNTTTVNENALAMANIAIDVTNPTGAAVIRTQNVNAVGLDEMTTSIVMYEGTNTFRVFESATVAATQSYRMEVTVSTTNIAPTASDGTFTDKVLVTWPAIPDATAYRLYRNTTDSTVGSSFLGTLGVVTSYDDTSAVPGTTYYYFLQAQQTGSTAYRYTNSAGEAGFVNAAPVADAGDDQSVVDANNSGSEPVTMDASGSSDSDGSINLYRWNEGATQLSNGTNPIVNLNLTVGVHTLTLTVTDNRGATATDTVIVTVTAPNQSPTADAGADQTVTDADNSGDEVVAVNGGASTDGDGTIVSYAWSMGVTTLASGSSPTANLTLPVGVNVVTLTVTDDDSATSTDTVTITVEAGQTGCLVTCDYNQDGGGDTTDVIELADAIASGSDPYPGSCMDYNQDGGADTSDVIEMANAIASGTCP